MLRKLLLVGCTVLTSHCVPHSLQHSWNRVATCENGGNWKAFSWMYPDALGINRTNFVQFGGNPNVRPSIVQQIQVGMRLIAYYHISIPDQSYCHSW